MCLRNESPLWMAAQSISLATNDIVVAAVMETCSLIPHYSFKNAAQKI